MRENEYASAKPEIQVGKQVTVIAGKRAMLYSGALGTVVEVDETTLPFYIKFADGNSDWFFVDEVDLYKPPATYTFGGFVPDTAPPLEHVIITPENQAEYDALHEQLVQGYEASKGEGQRLLSMYPDDKVTEIPCDLCGGAVIEFSIPNDIWNRVIRLDGHEHDKEYLCMACFFNALRKALDLPTK